MITMQEELIGLVVRDLRRSIERSLAKIPDSYQGWDHVRTVEYKRAVNMAIKALESEKHDIKELRLAEMNLWRFHKI